MSRKYLPAKRVGSSDWFWEVSHQKYAEYTPDMCVEHLQVDAAILLQQCLEPSYEGVRLAPAWSQCPDLSQNNIDR